MKNILVFLVLIALDTGHECFSQTQGSIVTTVGIKLVLVDDLFREHNVRTLNNLEDTLRVVDSILMLIAKSRQVVLPIIEVGISTIKDVREIWGSPVQEVIVLQNENKKKWIYEKMVVYFDHEIVASIIEKNN